ncbi:MAG: hypothetical protein KBS35_03245 [Mycoplasma sp.]|nr:hypothetical protein [Candidatus Hennigella equi]
MKVRKVNQDAKFVKNDQVRVPRSTFNRHFTHQTSFNAGLLIPLYCDEVLPGDTHKVKLSSIIRFTSPLIKPVMGEVDFYAWAFFEPNRLSWKGWETFITGTDQTAQIDWSKDLTGEDATAPYLVAYAGTENNPRCVHPGSVGDYYGLPVNVYDLATSTQDVKDMFKWTCKHIFNGYADIWNNWFRNQAVQRALLIDENHAWSFPDATEFADPLYFYTLGSPAYGGQLAPINRQRDYFSTALPAPQKGSAAIIGIGGKAPVTSDISQYAPVGIVTDQGEQSWHSHKYWFSDLGDGLEESFGSSTKIFHTSSNNNAHVTSGWNNEHWKSVVDIGYIKPYADLSQATAIDINSLRFAVQSQMIKEIDARFGTRYKETNYGHFGVISADARLQIPEFLGVVKIPLMVNQVVQNSSSTQDSAQGNVSAYSVTNSMNKFIFAKSFTEHGVIHILGGIRVGSRVYDQRLDKMFDRKTRFDYFWPELAHIGEQPVKNKEIFMSGGNSPSVQMNDEVWGYQEAWSSYKFKPNMVTGKMRPSATLSLDYWNFADKYDQTPTLSPVWLQDDRSVIDRCLAYPSINPDTGEDTGVPQFICDLYFTDTATRPVPLSSTPGLIDHSGRIVL